MPLTRLNIGNMRSGRLIEARGQSLENPSIPLSNPTPALLEALGIGPSTTGITVTERKAMTLSTVYACVRILAESLASLPLVTYERLPRGKQRAVTHPVYQLLHNRPNPEMTPFQFVETMQGHVALTGNAYAEIEWNGRGQPVNLWPITPDRVRVERVGGVKRYIVSVPTGPQVMIAKENMLHIPGFGYDGLIGYSPIGLMKQTVSLGMAAEEYGARFYGNGSKPSGLLTVPGKVSKEAKERLKASWEQMQGGLSNAHRVALLEEGMTWQQITINPNDAQFLETRRFQVSEIARIFRVPPHMIGDLDKATFSNIEQQSIEFVTNTLRPWAVRWEQALSYELFSDYSGDTYFAEFVMDALLRGDTAARYAAYAVGRTNGWLSANDIREMENMNQLPGDQGDLYLVPLNMVPAEQVARADEASETPADEADEDAADAADVADDTQAEGERSADLARWRMALAPVFADAAERVARREQVARERAEKRGVAIAEALDQDHESVVARTYAPAMRALVALASPKSADAVRSVCADKLAALHAAHRLLAIRAGATPPDPLPAVLADLETYFPTSTQKRIAA